MQTVGTAEQGWGEAGGGVGLRSRLRLPWRRAVCRMNARRRCWRPVNGSGGREPAGTSLIVDSRPVFVLTPFPVPMLGCEARGSAPSGSSWGFCTDQRTATLVHKWGPTWGMAFRPRGTFFGCSPALRS